MDLDLKKINARIKRLDNFLQRAEEILFNVESIPETEIDELKSDYEIARRTQLDLAEFVRKYTTQIGGDSDEVLELARRLRSLGEDQLDRMKHVVEGLLETRQ